MAIEFPCSSCQALIRTADGTEGKAARCPKCGSVIAVPQDVVPQDKVPPPATAPVEQPTSLNPYASPVNPFAHDPFQSLPSAELAQRAYWKLLWPAIGLITFAVLGLICMALAGFGFALDPDLLFGNLDQDPAQQAGAIGFLVCYFTVGFVTRVLQLLGAIAMIRQRGYGLALAGGVSALIPCEFYCCLPSVPLGIWALIMVNSAEVRAAFQR